MLSPSTLVNLSAFEEEPYSGPRRVTVDQGHWVMDGFYVRDTPLGHAELLSALQDDSHHGFPEFQVGDLVYRYVSPLP
jgi:hypothetical protein